MHLPAAASATRLKCEVKTVVVTKQSATTIIFSETLNLNSTSTKILYFEVELIEVPILPFRLLATVEATPRIEIREN